MKNEITLYLAHALANAPQAFRDEMHLLRTELEAIPRVRVLRYAWIDGVGTDTGVPNVYQHDLEKALGCDLLVGVLDHPSEGLAVEIRERCGAAKPFRLFISRECTRGIRFISEMIEFHRRPHLGARAPYLGALGLEMPDPIRYQGKKEIVQTVAEWVRLHSTSEPVIA